MHISTEVPEKGKPLILVVDDDPVIRMYLKTVLLQEGYDVETADDGEAALQLYQSLAPDLLILDVMMPKMTGIDVCESIKKQDGATSTPILMLTAKDDVESIEQSFSVGATDFIIKPVNLPIFKQRVRHALIERDKSLELLQNQSRLKHAHKVAKLGYWDWNIKSDNFYWSDEVYTIFSVSKDSFDNTYESFMARIHPDDVEKVERALNESLQFGTVFNIDHRLRHPEDKLLVVHEHAEVINDDSGKAIRMMGVAQDITERHIAQQTITHQAYYDNLTDLPNRMLFHDRLGHAMDILTRQPGELAIFFIDFDRFKNINDTLGHLIGDAFLRSVAERMSTVLRKTETLARLGGDEFAVIAENINSREDACKIAAKLVEELARPHILEGNELVSTASIGVTMSPLNGSDVDELIQQADQAMYYAKERGGNQYCFYTSEIRLRSLQSLLLENELRKALDNSELRVYYQPKVDIKTDTIVGMEALVRWQHPERGLVPPFDFIPIAEETGIIVRIGRWVLEEACQKTAEWHRMGYAQLSVSVNVSPMQFRQKTFVSIVKSVLKGSGLEPRCLELEVTESCMMHNIDETIQILNDVRALGVRVSIDDFGTGYSSLSYLDKMPIDTLKIDRAFIKDINARGENGELAKLIIAMAKSLDLHVVSEGVETEDHLRFLEKFGSDEYQGFLASPPLPGEEFESLLTMGIGKAVQSKVKPFRVVASMSAN